MGEHILPHFGYYYDELVSRNRVVTRNRELECFEGIFFMLKFCSKDGFESIDKALQEFKATILL